MGRNFMYLLIEKRLGYLSLYLPLFLLAPPQPPRPGSCPPIPPGKKNPAFILFAGALPSTLQNPRREHPERVKKHGFSPTLWYSPYPHTYPHTE
jgi:hypothetical protein